MGCSHIVKKGKNVLSLKTLDHLAPGMAHQASLAKVFPSKVFEHLSKKRACFGMSHNTNLAVFCSKEAGVKSQVQKSCKFVGHLA